jgi:hypothetical protein
MIDWLIDWLIMMGWDYISELRPPTAHPSADMWAWRAMVAMIMPPGYNSFLAYQSSLAVLPEETSGESRRNGRRSDNSAYQYYLKYLKGSLTCRKILRHGISGFTSSPKEGVLRIFIALKNPSPQSSLNPLPLGPVVSTLTTTPPRRFCETLS